MGLGGAFWSLVMGSLLQPHCITAEAGPLWALTWGEPKMLFTACLHSAFLLLSSNCSFNSLPPKHVSGSTPKIAALFYLMEEAELPVLFAF